MKELLLFSMLSTLALTVYAHGGRKNSEGCHTNRSTGIYHCHNGTQASLEVHDSKTYNRKEYHPRWIDADRDCQDTRQEVLIEESLEPVVLDSKGCRVIRGAWYDPYTDQTYTNPKDLDIDHLVPLKEVHESGGSLWRIEKKRSYANDLSNPKTLIAVYKSANRSKGARDPAQWMPSNTEYWCKYVRDWIEIKTEWVLTIDRAEGAKINEIISQCQ